MLTPINDILARSTQGQPEPEVGMGATELMWSDRQAYTVIAVSKNGKQAVIQRDRVTRTDKRGLSDSQSYEYAPDPNGYMRLIRLTASGQWKIVSLQVIDRWGAHYPDNEVVLKALDSRVGSATGSTVALGYRREYYDPSF